MPALAASSIEHQLLAGQNSRCRARSRPAAAAFPPAGRTDRAPHSSPTMRLKTHQSIESLSPGAPGLAGLPVPAAGQVPAEQRPAAVLASPAWPAAAAVPASAGVLSPDLHALLAPAQHQAAQAFGTQGGQVDSGSCCFDESRWAAGGKTLAAAEASLNLSGHSLFEPTALPSFPPSRQQVTAWC